MSIVPKAILEKIEPSRTECVKNGEYDNGLSSIADMVAYLFSASLKQPLPTHYARIYMYYASRLFPNLRELLGNDIPDKLTPYEVELANELRRKILSLQIRYMLRRSRK